MQEEILTTDKITLDKVLCEDAILSMQNIKEDNFFDIAIIDPPYNIGKDFGIVKDNLDLKDYLEWANTWLEECFRLVKTNAPIYIYGYPEILAHIAIKYPIDKQRWLAWHYTNKTVPTSKFWQRSYESILCLWKGEKPKLRVDAIREEYTDIFLKNAAGKKRKETFCRYSTKGKETTYKAHPKGALPRDVIKVSALAGGAGYVERYFFCKDCNRLCQPSESAQHTGHNIIKHPTQKPSKLTKKLINSATTEGGNILIPFAGSGAECVVAHQMKVHFFATEINPDYALLANKWIEKVKHKKLF